ncbi:MAG: hypothetical protein WDZ35_06190 [Crocinitomicaceae bacterium]
MVKVKVENENAKDIQISNDLIEIDVAHPLLSKELKNKENENN